MAPTVTTTRRGGTTSRLTKPHSSQLLIAAFLLIAGAPRVFTQGSVQQPQELVVVAPEGLRALAGRLMPEVRTILVEAREWTGLPPNSAPLRIEWVAGREELQQALGHPTPRWFAAVAIPSQRRIVIATEIAGSREQLRVTLRHELMHLAMADLDRSARSRLPAWFHEGCAQVFAGDIYLRDQNSSVGWLLTADELPPLSEFKDGFPKDSFGAAVGYHLGNGFVERLVRVHGLPSLQEVLKQVAAGDDFDTALIAVTGLGVISHEKELRDEISGLSGMSTNIYRRIFLGLSVFIIISFPIVRANRRRRRRQLELLWEEDDDCPSGTASTAAAEKTDE